MSNLFSSFDPQSFAGLPLNWASSFAVVFMLPLPFWLAKNQGISLMTETLKAVTREFSAILSANSAPGILVIPIALFLFIACNNAMGLTPYTFTSSSHLTFTVAMALPLWLGHMQFAWRTSPVPLLAHLVPPGTPAALLPLMVLIETTSSMIRPLTLSVRLTANMAAGHLLLGLLANSAPQLSPSLLLVVLSALIALSILESAVSFIQAYVFSVLSTLYTNEVNSPLLS